MRIIWSLLVLLVALTALVQVTGARVFVVKGNDMLQRQGTILVHGMHDFPLIDTPEAMCARAATSTVACEAGAAVGYLQTAKIIATFPFSQVIYDLADRL